MTDSNPSKTEDYSKIVPNLGQVGELTDYERSMLSESLVKNGAAPQ